MSLFYCFVDQLCEFEASDAILSVNNCVERQGSTPQSLMNRTKLLIEFLRYTLLSSVSAILRQTSIVLPAFLDLYVSAIPVLQRDAGFNCFNDRDSVYPSWKFEPIGFLYLRKPGKSYYKQSLPLIDESMLNENYIAVEKV